MWRLPESEHSWDIYPPSSIRDKNLKWGCFTHGSLSQEETQQIEPWKGKGELNRANPAAGSACERFGPIRSGISLRGRKVKRLVNLEGGEEILEGGEKSLRGKEKRVEKICEGT